MPSQERYRLTLSPTVRRTYLRASIPEQNLQEVEALRIALGRDIALVGREGFRFALPAPTSTAEAYARAGNRREFRQVVMEAACALDDSLYEDPTRAIMAAANKRVKAPSPEVLTWTADLYKITEGS